MLYPYSAILPNTIDEGFHAIIEAVGRYYDCSPEEFTTQGRKSGKLILARDMCAYLMCMQEILTLNEIKNLLGFDCHSSVIYSRRKMSKIAAESSKIENDINRLLKIINV